MRYKNDYANQRAKCERLTHTAPCDRKRSTSFSPSILLSLLCSSQLVSHSFLLSTHFLLNACHREKQRPRVTLHSPTKEEWLGVGTKAVTPLSDLPPAHQEDSIIILCPSVLEGDAMAIHVREVLLCFLPGAGSKTLIVLHLPSVCVLRLRTPPFKLRQTKEGAFLLVLAHLRTDIADS